MKKPFITKEVAEYFEALYPVEPPGPDDGLPRIYFNAGRADAARHIRELYAKQNGYAAGGSGNSASGGAAVRLRDSEDGPCAP